MQHYSTAAAERAMKLQKVIMRAMAKEITWYQAAEIIGISCWQMRRWKGYCERHGYERLLDRRRAKPDYLAFVTELVEESSPKQRHNALSWLVPEAFWIYYLGVLLFWLYDSSEDKEHTIAFLDRSLHVGVAFLTDGRR